MKRIIFLGQDRLFFEQLKDRSPSDQHLVWQRFEIGDWAFISELDHGDVSGIYLDHPLDGTLAESLHDLLEALSRRIPVFALTPMALRSDDGTRRMSRSSHDQITLVAQRTESDILTTLSGAGLLGGTKLKGHVTTLPFYNPHLASRLLRENGALSVLSIDASHFRKVETEYGREVYLKVKEVFQAILFELWSHGGSFRGDDMVCRYSRHGHQYLVFLNRSRDAGTLPRPGVLERIADRVNRKLVNALWSEVNKRGKDRRLPECIRSIPNVSVGFYSAMHNPGMDEGEIVNLVIETVFKSAKIQFDRMENLQRELMQSLIHRDDLMVPHYQGVFRMAHLSKAKVEQVQRSGSIAAIQSELYGFESLIRVRADALDRFVGQDDTIVSAKFLQPDVLFDIAKTTHVALELDQACIKLAARDSLELPGRLMVNILPRNLYLFEQLKHAFANHENVVFEVSESEGINNFALMQQVRQQLRDQGFGIAADDFGRGFAGLERIMKLQPDIIKLDRGLVENIHQEQVKKSYVKGLIDAAKVLGCTVLAEGVELWAEAEVLQKMGVDLIQGYLLHRPQHVHEVLGQLDPAFKGADVLELKDLRSRVKKAS